MPWYLVPGFDGAFLSHDSKDAPWDRFTRLRHHDGDRPVHAPPQFGFDVLELRSHAVASDLPLELEMSLRDLPQMNVNPRNAKVSGFQSPRFLRLTVAKRPDSIRRVLSERGDSMNSSSVARIASRSDGRRLRVRSPQPDHRRIARPDPHDIRFYRGSLHTHVIAGYVSPRSAPPTPQHSLPGATPAGPTPTGSCQLFLAHAQKLRQV